MTDKSPSLYEKRIEAIARAICKSRGYDPDTLMTVQSFTDVRRRAEGEGYAMPSKSSPISFPRWKHYLIEARAADSACLSAIETPTAEMLHATTMQPPTWDDDASRRKWHAAWSAIPRSPK